jgi:hypothetical protein
MAKRQRLSTYQLNDLPDEVILKILDFLDLKERLLCGQVSKRLRAIANDESLWLKVNLYERKVPYDFIKKAAAYGCQYLSLVGCDIIGLTGKSESSFNLKYLNVYGGCQGVQKLVQNCSSLQKLSVAWLELDSDDFQYICQSGQTLTVLDLDECFFDLHHLTESLKALFRNCPYLNELSIYDSNLLDPHIQALVDNLTPTILKVNFGRVNLKNEHVKKLVKRCKNITHLDLTDTAITNDSFRSIIEQLKASLEDLNVYLTHVDFATLFELKSMPALKTLICSYPWLPMWMLGDDEDDEDVQLDIEQVENLKQQLPHININEKRYFNIVSPFKKMNNERLVFCNQWIWEIRAKEQNLFAKQDRRIPTSNFYLLRMPIDNNAEMDQDGLDAARRWNNRRAAVKYRAWRLWRKE